MNDILDQLKIQTALLERLASALESRSAASAKPASSSRQETEVDGTLESIGGSGRLGWAFIVNGEGRKLKLKASGEHKDALASFADGDKARVTYNEIKEEQGKDGKTYRFAWINKIERTSPKPPPPARQASRSSPPAMPDFGNGAEDDIPF